MILFQGLKNSPRELKVDKNNLEPEDYLVKAASELLATKLHQEQITMMRSFLEPAQHFSLIYEPILNQFSEFVQNLPETKLGFFGRESEFLTQGLERATRTLSLILGTFFEGESDFSVLTAREALWLYAAFTASLLLDIGKIAVKYSIWAYQKNPKNLKKWNPYTGTLRTQGAQYYRFDYVKQNLDHLRQQVTPLLARQLLDAAYGDTHEGLGFNWIASDPVILEAWLAMLMGEQNRIPMTSFMAVIPKANIELLDHHKNRQKAMAVHPAGEQFLVWLRQQLQEGKISINQKDSSIYVTEKEVLLSKSLFEAFAQKHPKHNHVGIVEKQFIDVAQLYQISISDLDQRYRAHGGISGLGDIGKRYRAIGGLASVQENTKNNLASNARFLKGGIGLLALITPPLLHKELSISLLKNNEVILNPLSPTQKF